MDPIKRIHHISAIVGDPQANLTFYRDVLGLRLIKQTVNFDDPGVYHLYFANDDVSPGTVITFFPWTNDNFGRKGSGQVGRIAFRLPADSLNAWEDYLESKDIHVEKTQLFGKETLEFDDVHGLELAIVEGEETSDDDKILGFHGTVLLSENPEGTKELLLGEMGLTALDIDDMNAHFETVGDEKHHIVTQIPPRQKGRFGIGTVHHIAWSVPTEDVHKEWQSVLRAQGYHVTEVKDRNYFKALYLKEKGGIVIEFATDGPGFEIDESKSQLGKKLMLTGEYEAERYVFESKLPKLDV